MNAKAMLKSVILENGPILTARISHAKLGSCAWGPYYDVVPYQLRITRKGHLSNYQEGRASKSRRSYRKADLFEYCNETGRIELDSIGEITEKEAWNLLMDVIDGRTKHA